MRKQRTATIIAIAFAVGLTLSGGAVAQAGVTLITPQGAAVAGQWQRWANQSQVPTIRGRVIFVAPSELCGSGAPGCSVGKPFYGPTYKLAASDRQSLLFELGHLFDWRYLSWRNRAWLARQWRASGVPWLDSPVSLHQEAEDGLEGDFAAVYEQCAVSRRADIAGLWLDAPIGATVLPPIIRPRDGRSTCAFIRSVYRYGSGPQ